MEGAARATLTLSLPGWLEELAAEARRRTFLQPQEQMELVVELARRNVEEGTGGPFGAAVFEYESGRLVAAGVNLVLAGGCSLLHAETVALALAQQRLGSHDLGAPGLPACVLATSAEPCLMCYGAVLWSGVRELACGARSEDVEAVGFDEGPRPADWAGELRRRGILLRRDLLRAEAAAVLRRYADGGGAIYNPERPRS